MRGQREAALALLVLGLSLTAVQANTATGTIGAGSDAQDVASGFASEWNDSSDFICSTVYATVFRVTANGGLCKGRTVTLKFSVNGFGITNSAHDFLYDINCVGGMLSHTLGFDGQTPMNIDSTNAVFNLPSLAPEGGNDIITVETTEGLVPPVPALAPGGVIVLAGLLALCLLFVVRRRQLRLDPT